MADLIIHGSPNSGYLRTTRLACEEKGVAYELKPIGDGTIADLKAPAHLRLHPFGRMPVLQQGDFVLFESTAICRYVDAAFDGPALQPTDARQRALMDQWISAIKDYMTSDMNGFVIAHVFPSGPDGRPDQERIEAARPKIRAHLEILDRALAGRTYLAGADPSIADFLLTPILHYVGNMPGGLELFDGLDNMGRWWHGVSERPSFAATKPPMLEKAA